MRTISKLLALIVKNDIGVSLEVWGPWGPVVNRGVPKYRKRKRNERGIGRSERKEKKKKKDAIQMQVGLQGRKHQVRQI